MQANHNGNNKNSGRSTSRSKRKKLLLIVSATLAVSFILNLYLSVKLGSFAREVTVMTAVEQKLQRELAALKPKLEAMEQEISELTEKRLPGLVNIVYDEVLPVNQRFVKNIVFTRTGKSDTQHYEYKVVMDNRNLLPVRPEVKILFFDRVGVQVGFSELGMGNGLPITEQLERGEIRSYYSSVELAKEIEPKYFQVQIFSPDLNG